MTSVSTGNPLRFAAVILASTLLCGCAAFAGAPAAKITVHEQDAGRTFSVHVGDTVEVALIDKFFVPGSSIVWDADTSDGAVLERVSTQRESPPSIMNAQARYTATFRAVAPGTVTIRLVGTTRCEAMNPASCPGHSGTISIRVA